MDKDKKLGKQCYNCLHLERQYAWVAVKLRSINCEKCEKAKFGSLNKNGCEFWQRTCIKLKDRINELKRLLTAISIQIEEVEATLEIEDKNE